MNKYSMMLSETKICVIGLGYVGLPLARLFSTKYKTIGYDKNKSRVDALMNGHDTTFEISDTILKESINNGFECTDDINKIKNSNFYIVAVPTPVDEKNIPDLSPLLSASELVGSVIDKTDIVVFESTVYPGVSENECVPVIEKVSGLKFNEDFFIGYSPERNNPGDKKHTVADILKITSGSTEETAEYVNKIYSSVIKAGTYLAPSVKIAEAAKVIENTQRDINIAFVNELSHIFTLLGINTSEVIKAASTKWNFIPYSPGLVGGHCIGVDPYYLIKCAEDKSYNPSLIKSARAINNGMGDFVAQRTINLMLEKSINISESNILILGFTFKENCGDIRNTKVIDIYNKLMKYHSKVDIFDPIADFNLVKNEYGISLIDNISAKSYDAIIIAVSHDIFEEINYDLLIKPVHVIFDVKGKFEDLNSDASL